MSSEDNQTTENENPITSQTKSENSNSVCNLRFEDLLSEDSDEELYSEADNNVKNVTSSEITQFALSKPRSDTDTEQIILSLLWQNNYLGAAYYNVHTTELFVMNDVYEDGANFNVMKALYSQCQPHYVVTVSGTAESFSNAIKKLAIKETVNEGGRSGESSVSSIHTVFMIMPKRENKYEHCCYRVRCLKLESEPKNASAEDRLTYLNTILNFKCCAMINALGLLLRYVDEYWNKIALHPSGVATYASINYITLNDIVMMDEDSYKALNIVQPRNDSNFSKFGDTLNMQNTSLFRFLNRCQSRPGAQALWKILRHPNKNIDVLNERFDVVDFLMEPASQTMADNITSCLKHIRPISTIILNRYSATQAKVSDWQRLYKTLSSVIHIADICTNYTKNAELFAKIVGSVTSEMHHIKYFIEYVIDFDMSKTHNSIVVKTGVDTQLDELLQMKKKLPDILTEMSKKDESNLPSTVKGYNLLYMPTIGYVLGVTAWDGDTPSEQNYPNMEFKFTINNMQCFKSSAAKELDNTIGDITSKIAKRQSQIMVKLVKYISIQAGAILDAVRLCGQLDVLLSFAKISHANNYVKPKMVPSQVVDVKNGRHPFLEQTTTFVPNDIYSGNGKSLIKILTGPNACGKSIYLKQVALIIFMAHIGCFVPAESATIGIFTHILTQFQCVNSIALDTSTFLQDLRQISAALSISTPNALVVIDEFGLGTDKTSGFALLSAVLSTFADRGSSCPHIFASTHIHRVVEVLSSIPIIECLTFDYSLNEDGTLTFLYRLIDGHITCSFAHTVAKSSGLDQRVIESSKIIFDMQKKGLLPERLTQIHQKYMMCLHIAERVTEDQEKIDLEELKLMLRQAMMISKK